MNGSGQVSRGLQILLAMVIVVASLRYAQDVLIPLALATLMTFLLAPLVARLQRLGIPRTIGTVAAVTVAFLLIGGVIYMVVHQATDLAGELPTYRRQLRANIEDLGVAVRGVGSGTTKAVEQLTEEISRAAPAPKQAAGRVPKVQVVEPPPNAFEAIRTLFGPFLGPLGTAVVVVVFVIFMLLRLPDLRDRLIRLLGQRNLRATTEALDDAARRVSRYLLMQMVINGVQGVLVTVGLTLIGLPNAALFGALTLVLRFIPYVGPWVAAAMPILLAVAVFDSWTIVAMTIALFIVLETISNLVLEPWLYGSQTGVSPVALLVAAAFWTWLWGAVGLFLAIPLTVCLVVMGKYIPQLGFLHVLLSDEPVLTDQQRLYQRLLAGNSDEADELLDASLREQSFLEVCDETVVPAVLMVEGDYDRGALSEERRHLVLEHLDAWVNDETDSPRHRDRMAQFEKSTAQKVTVLCAPAAGRADALCSKLLALALAEEGVAAQSGSPTALGSEFSDSTLRNRPDAIVVSSLPPEAVIRARAVCRRVGERFPGVRCLVGLWQTRLDEHVGERLSSAGASGAVVTFAECLRQVRMPAVVPPTYEAAPV
jgi:predicted PurR-regulated permease PerM/methylmalonyl-CoA mutase cobalamin-binding subunit